MTPISNATIHDIAHMFVKTIKNIDWEVLLVPALVSAFTSLSILVWAPKYFLAVILVILPFIIIFIINKPFVLFQIIIVIMPFSLLPILNVQIMGVPGLKVTNILIVATFGSFIFAKLTSNRQLYERVFIAGMLSLLLIAVYRAIPNIPIFNMEMDENFSAVRFFQTFFLKPIIYFSPFILISLYFSNNEQLELALKTFVLSILIFSLVLLAIYMFHTPDKTNFENIRKSFANVTHLHGNNIATIYILSFPITMSYFYIKRNAFSILCILLSLITIGLLYSRTAYAVILVSIFLYLFISKRMNGVPLVCCLLVFGVINLPSSITERFLTGIESKNVQQISAGRVSDIWVPIISELKESPKTLLIGNGMRGYWSTEAFKKGQVYGANHAHNLYLDTILDIGILGLFSLAFFCFIFLAKLFKSIQRQSHDRGKNELLYGVVVSILSFLISGVTGRLWYPVIYNYPLWLVLAIGSATIKLQVKEKTS